MKHAIHLVAALILAFAASAAVAAEQLRVESTFTDRAHDGKPRTLRLPAATVESGKPAEIHFAPYAFKFTATLNADRTVTIATVIEKAAASGKREVLSRPTILTAPGKSATISVGDGAQRISLEQLVTIAK